MLKFNYLSGWVDGWSDKTKLILISTLVEVVVEVEVELGNNKNNPHLNFLKGTVLGDKEQGLGIRGKGQGIRTKWSLTLNTKSCFLFFH